MSDGAGNQSFDQMPVGSDGIGLDMSADNILQSSIVFNNSMVIGLDDDKDFQNIEISKP